MGVLTYGVGVWCSPTQAATDITSRYDGKIVKLYYDVGEMALTGTPLVDIELEGDGDEAEAAGAATADDAGDSATAEAPAAAAPSVGQAPMRVGGKVRARTRMCVLAEAGGAHRVFLLPAQVLATPAVRRIAREHDLDLAQVRKRVVTV